jgi:hypothetical protein
MCSGFVLLTSLGNGPQIFVVSILPTSITWKSALLGDKIPRVLYTENKFEKFRLKACKYKFMKGKGICQVPNFIQKTKAEPSIRIKIPNLMQVKDILCFLTFT